MRNLIYAFKKILNNKTGKIGEKWKYDAGSSLNSGPVVSDVDGDGKLEIITGTTDGKIIALDMSGNVKWLYNIQEQVDDLELMFLDTDNVNSVGNTPYAGDIMGDGSSNIVFGTELGYIYLLNFEGKLIWKFKTEGAIRGKVIVSDVDGEKRIIFGSTDGHLYCISKDAKLIWKFNAASSIEGTSNVYKNSIIFGCKSGLIYSLKLDNGEVNWKFETGSNVVAQPIINNLGSQKDYILIGSTDTKLYCLDLQGNIVWTYKTEGAIYSEVTLSDINNDGKPEILFGSCDNFVYCLNNEGKKLWSFETNFWVVSAPLVVDIDNDSKKEIIVGSYDHNIYVLDNEGSYLLDYTPGISGTVNQAGNYSDVMTQEPGNLFGKKIWQFNVEGMVVGCTILGPDIVLNTKKGHITTLSHQN